jgi:hypothetical protein
LREVLDAALRLEGHPGLEPGKGDLEGSGAILRSAPNAWGSRCAASLKDAKGRLRTLVFDPEVAGQRRDVTLIHLDHPLMRRALSSFRKNMFSLGLGESERLQRVTYQVVPDGVLPAPLLVANVRLLGVGRQGQKLHEEIRSLVCKLVDDDLLLTDAELLELIPAEAPFPEIPTVLGMRLKQLVERHEPKLRALLEEVAEGERERLGDHLDRRCSEETQRVREMIASRRNEIQARLRQIRRQLGKVDPDQLRLVFGGEWQADEVEQFKQDIRALERRLETLAEQADREPERIESYYRLRSLKAFPLGLRFVLPASAVEKGLV